jgi:hypothetical protein
MEDNGKIIRAGFKSSGFIAGTAEVNIAGTFSSEDATDLISLLEMVIRSVKRQAESACPENAPPPKAEEVDGGK